MVAQPAELLCEQGAPLGEGRFEYPRGLPFFLLGGMPGVIAGEGLTLNTYISKKQLVGGVLLGGLFKGKLQYGITEIPLPGEAAENKSQGVEKCGGVYLYGRHQRSKGVSPGGKKKRMLNHTNPQRCRHWGNSAPKP